MRNSKKHCGSRLLTGKLLSRTYNRLITEITPTPVEEGGKLKYYMFAVISPSLAHMHTKISERRHLYYLTITTFLNSVRVPSVSFIK